VTTVDVTRHNTEIERNLESWRKKPLLRRIYRAMHEEIATHIVRDVDGAIVEVGSGIGNIKEVLPGCLRTDLFPNPWLDQTENAYALSFADGAVSNLILFDVFHHLRYPGTALREFHRVLAPGGRVLIYEPAMGLLGRLVFGLFHHEPVALTSDITWLSPDGWRAQDVDYYAAQGNASRVFGRAGIGSRFEGLELVSVAHYAQISYVASGGYSHRQLYPDALYPAVKRLDKLLDLVPSVFSTRLLAVLAKPAAKG
jgi:SAM-dependent methyltransferase